VVSVIGDLLTSLATCLCSQIKDAGGPELCFCGVVPGASAIMEYAGDDCSAESGMAWVRLMAAYPADGVGVPSETAGNCGASIGLDIELGIMRKVEVPDADGTPPDAASLLAASLLAAQDILTMRRAVACCAALPNKDYILSGYTPMGPMGGMVGGWWTLAVAL
jgi:hypothetical protein